MQQPVHRGVIVSEDRYILQIDAIEDVGVRVAFERELDLALVFEASRPSNDLLFAEAFLLLGGDDDDVRHLVHRKDIGLGELGLQGLQDRAKQLAVRAAYTADDVRHHDAGGGELGFEFLEKFSGGEVKRDRVGVIGVEKDGVIPLRSLLQKDAPIHRLHPQVVAFLKQKITLGDVDHLGV